MPRPVTSVHPPNPVGNTADTGPPDPPPTERYTGITMYSTSGSSVGAHDGKNSAADATQTAPWELLKKLESVIYTWAEIELTNGVFTWPPSLDATITDAHNDGYKVIMRFQCGVDSPIRTAASKSVRGWMATDPTRPVPFVTTLQNERNPIPEYNRQVIVPVGWDQDYDFYHDRFYGAVKNRLNGACPVDASHSRKEHVYFIPATQPTESGTEMSIGYGQVATTWYTPNGTLGTTLNQGATTFTISGLSTYWSSLPTNFLIVISPGTGLEEHIFVRKTTGGTTGQVTVNANGRGWNRHNASTDQDHAIGAPVWIAQEQNTSGTSAAQINFDFFDGRGPLTGIFDHVNLNMKQWDRAVGKSGAGSNTNTNRRVWYGDAWKRCIIQLMNLFPTDVKIGVAGGGLFNTLAQSVFGLPSTGENLAQGNRILDEINGVGDVDRAYGERFVAHCTNFTADSATQKYAQIHSGESNWLLKAKNYGHFIGVQTEGTTVWPNSLNFVYAMEDGILTYGIHFMETGSGRFTDNTAYATPAVGGWPGGSSTLRNYMLEHATKNLQKRLPT